MATQPVLLEVSVETARSLIDRSNRGGRACKSVRAARKQSFQQRPKHGGETTAHPALWATRSLQSLVLPPLTDLNATNTLLINLLFL